MTLTKEEIEMIEREAEETYPYPPLGAEGVSNRTKGYKDFARNGYKAAATKYLLQLKAERERAGKLMEALVEVQAGSLTGQLTRLDMNKVASKAINEYNKP